MGILRSPLRSPRQEQIREPLVRRQLMGKLAPLGAWCCEGETSGSKSRHQRELEVYPVCLTKARVTAKATTSPAADETIFQFHHH